MASDLERSTPDEPPARTFLLDALLPRGLLGDAEARRRGRLFVAMLLVLVGAAVFFSVSTYSQKNEVSPTVIVLAIGAVLAGANLPLVHALRSLQQPSLLLCAEHVLVIFAVGYFGGGVRDPGMWWMAPAPIIAAFLIGPTAGFVSAGAGMIGAAALFGLGVTAMKPFNPPVNPELFTTLATITVLGGMAALAWVYEASRRDSLERVERAMLELTRTNQETRAINDALAAARDKAVADGKRKTTFVDRMRDLSRRQEEALEQTRGATDALLASIRSIGGAVETLTQAAHNAERPVAEVDAGTTKMAEIARSVSTSVDETDRALQALRTAATGLQQQFETLRKGAEQTAQAMVAAEDSVAAVEQGARATAGLSEQVILDAERGQEAVRRTRSGIAHIRASSAMVGESIGRLGERAGNIGQILTVIDEVVAETSVLALNASIIAAQSGEQGRGFAVVAEQIKALADRTAKSTRQIGGVIVDVQRETRHAAEAMAGGAEAVRAGVDLSEEAERALDQIVLSAREAMGRVKAIEGSTVAQVSRAREVGAAMADVMRMVNQSAATTREQVKATTSIDGMLARIRKLVPELQAQASTQATGASTVLSALSRVRDSVERLSLVERDQTQASERTLQAIAEIERAQRDGRVEISSLHDEPAGSASPKPSGRRA